jgi:hypothetical protein
MSSFSKEAIYLRAAESGIGIVCAATHITIPCTILERLADFFKESSSNVVVAYSSLYETVSCH